MATRKPTIARGNVRRPLQATVSVKPYGAKRSSKAQMYDLSVNGCCLISNETLPTGTQVLVRIPGLEFSAATVAWQREGAVGVEFHRPLHPAMVERYARFYPVPMGPAEV